MSVLRVSDENLISFSVRKKYQTCRQRLHVLFCLFICGTRVAKNTRRTIHVQLEEGWSNSAAPGQDSATHPHSFFFNPSNVFRKFSQLLVIRKYPEAENCLMPAVVFMLRKWQKLKNTKVHQRTSTATETCTTETVCKRGDRRCKVRSSDQNIMPRKCWPTFHTIKKLLIKCTYGHRLPKCITWHILYANLAIAAVEKTSDLIRCAGKVHHCTLRITNRPESRAKKKMKKKVQTRTSTAKKDYPIDTAGKLGDRRCKKKETIDLLS